MIWGALADIYPRKWFWIIGTIIWCLCSFFISFTENFVQVLIVRMLFGVFMAVSIPYGVSLLSDYTLPHERGIAQAIFASGVYLGVGMSSISVLIDLAVGWRGAVRLISLICLVFVIP